MIHSRDMQEKTTAQNVPEEWFRLLDRKKRYNKRSSGQVFLIGAMRGFSLRKTN
ncbi:oligopeptide transport system permease protein OppC [Sporolactobacillus inulinus]|uniref:Oligopeptide transport system permease protein OppC n=1 Tax=Sporolactobacillus inulinus TaxID=2078 RepID=A0A4Y1ZGY2_9BACL|nr:oligopeptide transport system permease protein OppC [Sporolactobacillus inulinus]